MSGRRNPKGIIDSDQAEQRAEEALAVLRQKGVSDAILKLAETPNRKRINQAKIAMFMVLNATDEDLARLEKEL